MKIPLVDLNALSPSIQTEIESAVAGVLRKKDFVLGETLVGFEEEFAAYVGTRNAIGVGSGFDALRLILLGLGIGQNDEVIVPANTFFATAAAVTAVGASPVFIDVEEETANLDSTLLEELLTPQTKAVIGVHLYGQCCDVKSIGMFCKRNKLYFIEDAAQAHGAQVGNPQAGCFGDAAAFSFYPGKNLGAFGDGGIIVTNNDKLAEKLKLWRNHGLSSKHVHEIPGHNSRLDTLQAAVLRVKLQHLNNSNDLRRNHAKAYQTALQSLEGIQVLTRTDVLGHVFHLFVIRVANRDKCLNLLQTQGIGAQVHYPTPIPFQPAYNSLAHVPGDFPIAERLSQEILSLPLYPELTNEQRNEVIAELQNAMHFCLQPQKA